MAKQTINIGAAPNDGTGTPLRTSFDYCNQNFTELYTATGPSGNNIVVPGSATITGDLTVDTSTLKVDSANNRVGIGTASPGFPLDIIGASGVGVRIYESSTGNNNRLQITQEGTETRFNSTFSTGSAFYTWQIASSEQMRLNSTGLGVGDSPFAGTRLTLRESATNPNALAMTNRNATQTWRLSVDVSAVDDKILGFYDSTSTTFRMQLTDTGNLGIGVTPSAWDTANYKALQVSRTAVASLSNIGIFSANWFADTGGDKYIANGTAARIDVNNSGQIQFKIAPNNTLGANQPITFTQAMTLDASGNLLVGKTSIGDSNVGVQLMPTAGLSMSLASQTNAQTTCAVYSTTAADYRFYVGMGGTVYATNTAISPITSDERLKQNIVDYDKGLEEVLALRPRHFEYKAEPNRKLAGFISQEVKTVIPDAIRPTLQDPEMMTYEIDWYPLLVKAIQELTARVQTLEAR